jgi:hypothetical protein
LPGRVAEVAAIFALAAIVTVAIAAPVLRAPSERVFGMEIVGRHHDPFTVMAALERPIAFGIYSQPFTDITGALLARLSGGVAAYNWLVLLSFPLSAAAAYLLARYLALSSAGATVAAMAYAFSPFHLAQAAYHPHIAQTQWLPLYLLALWRCLDDASPAAVTFLGIATATVTLSNFYGGLIAAIVTPVAVAAYWLVRTGKPKKSPRSLVITIAALALLSVAGLAYVWWTARSVLLDPAAFAFAPGDVFRYSAKWWGYLVPPVAPPLLGEPARRVWIASGVRDGLLEQQVSLGGGIVALGLFALCRGLTRSRHAAGVGSVPVLAAVALAALVCSLSPERTIGGFRFVRPSALLQHFLPMFRAYARFGVVVQLMAVLLAGVGVDVLRQAGTRRARIACLALLALAAAEYVVAPSALWRDVLPTQAHRWVVNQVDRMRVVDCAPLTQDSLSIQWLTGYRMTTLGGSITDCTEPNLSQKLAANGYTHLLVRRDTAYGQWFIDHPTPDGLDVAARFADGQVFAVTAPTPAIYTATITGFLPREHDAEWTWRWMGRDAAWTIVNTRAQPVVTALSIELSAFHQARRIELLLDGRPVQAIIVAPARRTYQIAPFTVDPGGHELVFHPAEPPTVAGEVMHDGDRRLLSFALGTWSWDGPGVQR